MHPYCTKDEPNGWIVHHIGSTRNSRQNLFNPWSTKLKPAWSSFQYSLIELIFPVTELHRLIRIVIGSLNWYGWKRYFLFQNLALWLDWTKAANPLLIVMPQFSRCIDFQTTFFIAYNFSPHYLCCFIRSNHIFILHIFSYTYGRSK